MTPERWQQVKELLESVLEREPGQRAAFLEEACAGDAELRKEVESLLAFHEQAESFIERPAVEITPELFTDQATELMAGRRIGPYKILREIGHGGMGAVYLAVRDDDQYQRRVAIKLVKRGMDTKDILRRFRNERQILASLDHPNIAKLLDGGTTDDGLPYFVMEHIEGAPIDEYCDTHKLSTVERLALFRTVCAAVHYAHQNLIVHRDLKPSNILVTADGTPKLLDFGIAKLLNPELSARTIDPTRTELRLMTPEYASPEQIRGEPITTASDIYSLGVVLYSLLTGHSPYRVKSRAPQEVFHVVCEEEPAKPSTAVSWVEEVPGPDGTALIKVTPEMVSKTREGQPETLRRRLAGDLDNIVLMAIRKEPQRRYASVAQFSEDIGRHLSGMPVLARKSTLSYRTAKFIKRNKAGVIAAALVVLALVAGIVSTLWEARVAREQRAEAERRFNDVRKLANSFMFEFYDAIKNLQGSTPAQKLLVSKALEYLDSLARGSRADSSLQRELAMAYERVGDVQGNPYHANLGDPAGAIASYRKALVIREALVKAEPGNLPARRDLSMSYDKIADMLGWSGDLAGALENYRKSLAVRKALSEADPTNVRDRRALAVSYAMVGNTQMWTGDMAGALEHGRKTLEIFEALAAANPASAPARLDLAIAYEKVGEVLAANGDTAAALENFRKSLAIEEPMSAAEPTNAKLRRNLELTYNNVGDMLTAIGDRTGALANYREALAIAEALAKGDATNARARRDLSVCYNKVGDVLAETGDRKGALASFRKALAIREALLAPNPTDAQARRDLTVCYEKIGNVLLATGDTAEALQNHRRATVIREELSAADKANAEARRDLAVSYSKMGDVYAKLATAGKQKAHWREARSWYQRSLDTYLELRARGALKGSDAGLPDEVSSAIAKCDAALARLH